MIQKLKPYHPHIYFASLCILIIGLPFSKFLMSVGQIILFGNWILEGDIKHKLKQFLSNKVAVVLSSVFLFHLLGLLYTLDFDYGFEDVRKKIPLALLPLVLSTSPKISSEKFNTLLHLFCATIFASTLYAIFIYLGVGNRDISNTREISVFISHIRFALLICITIFISVWFLFFVQLSFRAKLAYALFPLWLIGYLIISESLTGIFILILTIVLISSVYITRQKNKNKKVFAFIFIIVNVFTFYSYLKMNFAFFYSQPTVAYSKYDTQTKLGNPYTHDTLSLFTENGNNLWVYVASEELDSEWNTRSKIPLSAKDKDGNDIYYTLVRFMSSKGLKKDAEGLASLKQKEIEAVENGVSNYLYLEKYFLRNRIHATIWEVDNYLNGGNPSGHSLVQRFEFWKAATQIIKNNFWTGVGTGDVKNAFEKQYEEMKSPLTKEYRLRSHNQFLEIAVGFGIVGLLIFLFSLFYPFIYHKGIFNYLYLSFFFIALFSFFTEDTLETQAGVTFYAFLSSFFLFVGSYEKN